jgi:hypothetical protein
MSPRPHTAKRCEGKRRALFRASTEGQRTPREYQERTGRNGECERDICTWRERERGAKEMSKRLT